ncbi:MAG: hypothetical protein ACKO0M_17980 [Cyanobium sp.]
MRSSYLRQVSLLSGPDQDPQPADVLLQDGVLCAIGPEAAVRAAALGLAPLAAEGWLLAPALVDPHSLLEDPHTGVAETLASLERSAIAAGYGTVALLPQAQPWRDSPAALSLPRTAGRLRLLLWGSLSRGGAGQELAPHAELLAAGAVGLAEGPATPPLPLLERALALGEMGDAPLLLAPRDRALSQQGFVREGVETLRAGWPADPPISETLPLQALLTLQALHPSRRLQLMNLSTAGAVQQLMAWPAAGRPSATVCWWHLWPTTAAWTPPPRAGDWSPRWAVRRIAWPCGGPSRPG